MKICLKASMKGLRLVGLSVGAALLLAACGDDMLSDVPSGEIVPLEERDRVLTGFDRGPFELNKEAGGEGEVQRWWRNIESRATFRGCDGEPDSDMTDRNLYVAFTPEGRLLHRSGRTGTAQDGTGWNWASAAKNSLRLDIDLSVEFEITSLNPDQVVYASVQPLGSGCTAITWEQFGEPFTE